MMARPWYNFFNDVPPSLEYITEERWWKLFDNLHHATTYEMKQIRDTSHVLHNQTLSCFIHEFDRTGFGYVRIFGGGRPYVFFRFAECQHEYEVDGNDYECAKCGHSYTVDSSG